MADRLSGAIYRFKDVDNDQIAVFPAEIPRREGVGNEPGVNIRTSPNGSSLPLSEIPKLIDELEKFVYEHEIGRR